MLFVLETKDGTAQWLTPVLLHIKQEKCVSLYSWFGLVLPASFFFIHYGLSCHIVGVLEQGPGREVSVP